MMTNMANAGNEDIPILIKVSEAARLLNVSTLAIYNMIHNGRLASVVVPGCTIKVDQREIAQMIRDGYKPQKSR